ncbi:MAG TPA: response regulator [Patescibacteria group bacterium]|nr:response regulator [Patescibacteria group bacterium]
MNNPASVKVLIIEDDRFLRELMAEKLTVSGYTVVEGVDGEDGFAKIKSENPSVVLLDLILPGMDGFSILRETRKIPQFAKTPIFVLSNLGQAEDIQRAVSLGATDYLIKAHFTPADIVTKLQELFPVKS